MIKTETRLSVSDSMLEQLSFIVTCWLLAMLFITCRSSHTPYNCSITSSCIILVEWHKCTYFCQKSTSKSITCTQVSQSIDNDSVD